MNPTPTKPLEVSLYVCPACHQVGKLSIAHGYFKGYCTGPAPGHPKRRMEMRVFREVTA